MSADRAYRIWRQSGLQVPRKRPRKRVATRRPRPLPTLGKNQVWAYDFVYDACANGRQLKCLTVIDEYTRVFSHRCCLEAFDQLASSSCYPDSSARTAPRAISNPTTDRSSFLGPCCAG